MAESTRGRRLVRWCRRHPKSTGLSAALVALLATAGALGHGGNTDRDPVAASSVGDSARPSRSATSTSASPATGSARSATTVLASLTIKGRAPKTGYSREQFGAAWTDDNDTPLGHNGCDTRIISTPNPAFGAGTQRTRADRRVVPVRAVRVTCATTAVTG